MPTWELRIGLRTKRLVFIREHSAGDTRETFLCFIPGATKDKRIIYVNAITILNESQRLRNLEPDDCAWLNEEVRRWKDNLKEDNRRIANKKKKISGRKGGKAGTGDSKRRNKT